ncbi:discoidin, CUB and LCCL domain-containing protein 2-like [Branchiostoma floridae x Branchiostoma japonicum]
MVMLHVILRFLVYLCIPNLLPVVESDDTVDCSTDFRRFNDDTFTVTCPAGCVTAFKLVWGTGAYTGDSGICRAAIHDGRITDDGGQVTVYRWPGQDSYQGSTQNGIRTIRLVTSSKRWAVSFAFTRVCRDALGMENATIIEDDDITASSHQNSRPPSAARLNGDSAWVPLFSRGSWIQVDLKQRKTVSGVITQGFVGIPQSWVTQYQVWYVNNHGKWAAVRSWRGSIMSFPGNTDPIGQKTNIFDRPIVTQKIQLYPTRWRTQIGLRMELLGCDFIVSTTQPAVIKTTSTTQPTTVSNMTYTTQLATVVKTTSTALSTTATRTTSSASRSTAPTYTSPQTFGPFSSVTSSTTGPFDGDSSLGVGAILGIATGVSVLLIAMAVFVIIFFRKRRLSRDTSQDRDADDDGGECMDMDTVTSSTPPGGHYRELRHDAYQNLQKY